MKLHVLHPVLFFSIGILVGCSHEIELVDFATEASYDLQESQISVLFLAKADTASVTVHSNGKWSIEATNDRASSWLTYSPEGGGKGDTRVKIEVTANDEYEERSAVLHFRNGKEERTINVVQKPEKAFLVSSEKAEFGPSGGSFDVMVTSNISYTLTIVDAPWLHQVITRGVEETLSFTVDRNDRADKRQGKLVFVSELGTETVTVYQTGVSPQMILSANAVDVPSEGGRVRVDVSSNFNVEYSISADWICEITTRSLSTNSYSFYVERNPDFDGRSAEIVFRNAEKNISETVTIHQSQQDAIVLGQGTYEIDYKEQTFSMTVSANVDVQVEIPEGIDWLTPVRTKGLSDRTLTFSVTENTTKEPREAYIILTSGDLRQSVRLSQLPTTHFPETKDEISESVDLTYVIGDKVSVILGTTYDKNADNLEEVALEMEKVAGVQRVDILSTRKTIAVMQRDSVWLNFFLDSDAFSDNGNEADGTHSFEADSQHAKSKRVNKTSDNLPEVSNYSLNGKTALVLQPFYTDGGSHEYDMLDDLLEVKHLKDNQCSLAHFKGDYLDDFDVILIETHGGASYRMYDPDRDDGIGKRKETTSFSTHVMYSKELAEMILKSGSLSREQVAITFTEDPNGAYPSANDETILLSPIFAMTPDFLEGADFNNTVVYLNTCHSGEQIGDRPYGDMVPAFLNKGAGIVAFNNDTVKQKTSYYCVYNFFEMLAHGISFQDAYKSIITSYDVRLFCNTYWDYIKNDKGIKPEDQGYTCIYNRLLYKMNDDINAKHFFLSNSVPQLSSDAHGTLEWECSLDSFSTTWPIYTTPMYDLVVDYTVSYDVYVDRHLFATVKDSSDKSVNYSTPGDYKWYVIANVTKHIPSINSHGEEGYELVASYRSAEMDFTVYGNPMPPTTGDIEGTEEDPWN